MIGEKISCFMQDFEVSIMKVQLLFELPLFRVTKIEIHKSLMFIVRYLKHEPSKYSKMFLSSFPGKITQWFPCVVPNLLNIFFSVEQKNIYFEECL